MTTPRKRGKAQAVALNKIKVSKRNILLESYCENSGCQVRYFHFLIKPLDREEIVHARKLHCPLCGRQTSRWVKPSLYDRPLPRQTSDTQKPVTLLDSLGQEGQP